MHTPAFPAHYVTDLSSLLEELTAGCDPEFDLIDDSLEREFVERRLTFSPIA